MSRFLVNAARLPLEEQIKMLPDKPGVYQFVNSAGVILYVGKAKSLAKRVRSYFSESDQHSRRIKSLVNQVADIIIVIVSSESEALLLENNLIKQHQPKYNILLKDDKTYPWIAIKNEEFPRIFKTRHYLEDGSRYFGPYTSGYLVKTLLDLIRALFPIRTCNYRLSEQNILSGKLKPCLEYQIGNCLAPCIGGQSGEDYERNITEVRAILTGNVDSVIAHLTHEMQRKISTLNFEEAEIVSQKVQLIKKYKSKAAVVTPKGYDIDVFTIVSKQNISAINYLRVVHGYVVSSLNLEMRTRLGEENQEVLSSAITAVRNMINSNARVIVTSIMPDFTIEGVKYVVPVRGENKSLLDLSMRNSTAYLHLVDSHGKTLISTSKTDKLLEKIKQDLRLSSRPNYIECFDNSNLQGAHPVAACVVFRNGKPARKEYRHFIIKTVTGPDDYASMAEIVYRRYKKLIDENLPIPQLIVIDGGKGQLNAAIASINMLNLASKTTIIGIAKRLEEIYLQNDPVPIYLDKNSSTLRAIQHIRNEAHRFGVRLHTNRRSKNATTSVLNEIRGIGDKTIQTLFLKFKSVEAIKTADRKSLESVVGRKKTTLLLEYFNGIIE